jgi:hypothetical protein
MIKNRKTNSTSPKIITHDFRIYAILLIVAVAITIIIRSIPISKAPVTSPAKQNIEKVVLSLKPVNLTTPNDGIIAVYLDAKSYPIAFTQLRISFDQTKIKLIKEIETSDKFQNIFLKSTPEQANSEGLINISLAVFDPLKFTTPPPSPTGNIQLATLTFKPVTGNTVSTVPINFVASVSQINANNLSANLPVDYNSLDLSIK